MFEDKIRFQVRESVDGGYEARAERFSIFTQADSLEELTPAIQDAAKCHFGADQRPDVLLREDFR